MSPVRFLRADTSSGRQRQRQAAGGNLPRFWFERPPPETYLRLLRGKADVVGLESRSSGDPYMGIIEAEAVIAGGQLKYRAEQMDPATQLRVIARTGIGVDNVDVLHATSRGIAVCNVPDGPAVSTAEHALLLMLAAAKNLRLVQLGTEHPEELRFNDYLGVELDGSVLGLVGLGRVGMRVARTGKALGMRVIAYDPYLAQEEFEARGAESMPDLPGLLRIADIVSLHVPLTELTRGLIGRREMGHMKRGAILVNTARGGLVDEEALIHALESGSVGAAGLDVFASEPPPPDSPLLHHPKVIATPHRGGATVAARDRTLRSAIAQALDVVAGRRPRHLVNPEVWQVRSAHVPNGVASHD
jgi:D-3-phosphoglycerate dehydrogenase